MSQSKTASTVEVMANQTVGFLLSLLVGVQLYRYLNIDVSMTQNLKVTIVFITVALCRSYLMRRAFNWWDTTGRDYFKLFLRKALRSL